MTKFLNISTDNTLGGNSPSDEIVSSQKAIKTYIDTNADNVVWVTYNSTPFADIRAAMQAGKIVLLKYTTDWNEYILRATNLILGATEYIYFTALDTYTHVAYARVSSAEAWVYGGQTNVSTSAILSSISSSSTNSQIVGAKCVYDLLATKADTSSIPTVNDATITITQGGVTKGSFTLNQASGDTIALDAGGGGGSYTAGSGIDITSDVISVDDLDCGTMS